MADSNTGNPNTRNPVGDPVVKGFEVSGKPSANRTFDRFQKLTSKLVQVPKTELDEKRQQA
jgi:hypothetical protein